MDEFSDGYAIFHDDAHDREHQAQQRIDMEEREQRVTEALRRVFSCAMMGYYDVSVDDVRVLCDETGIEWKAIASG